MIKSSNKFLILFFILTQQVCGITVHVFGDSHSKEFAYVPGCKVNWLGPITMHRVGRDGLPFLDVRKFGVKEGDAVLYSFGEIDARLLIGKQRDVEGRDLDEVIETLITNYVETVMQNRYLYHRLHSIVYSVTPPINGDFSKLIQSYGSVEDRVHIVKHLNAKLKDLCSKWNIHFLDVYDDYALEDGTLNPALSDGSTHIHEKCNQALIKKLNEILALISS